ncbi:MAG: MgtC/SapB family protein [Clostridia bacterium]|nr:MgtC/SapB family protein [Clostridia bacterium]
MLLSHKEIIIRLFVALLVGAVLGIERTKARKPAGVRTHALVCITSTMISIISAYGFGEFGDHRVISMDPARLIVGIITGIGFLGAGIIWKDTSRGDVRGLTTAANIWASAALGIAIGLGHYFLVLCTVMAIFIALRLGVILVNIGLIKYDMEDRKRVLDSSRD